MISSNLSLASPSNTKGGILCRRLKLGYIAILDWGRCVHVHLLNQNNSPSYHSRERPVRLLSASVWRGNKGIKPDVRLHVLFLYFFSPKSVLVAFSCQVPVNCDEHWLLKGKSTLKHNMHMLFLWQLNLAPVHLGTFQNDCWLMKVIVTTHISQWYTRSSGPTALQVFYPATWLIVINCVHLASQV